MLLEMQGISKSFSGVSALEAVDFSLAEGEVHALVGENGAGKSTLMKILSGAQPPDAGSIRLNERRVRFRSVAEAKGHGVVMVYQELELVPELSIAENLFLGRLPPLLRHASLRERAKAFLARVGLGLDPGLRINQLGVGEKQLVVIARALIEEGRVLILDEPTAALTAQETRRLFEIIRSLKEHGVGVIYISHRLEEVFELAERVTVLRDGRRVVSEAIEDTSPAEVVRHMVGRQVDHYQRRQQERSEPLAHFRIDGQGAPPLELSLHRGEIVGLAGVIGSGRSEVLAALFGSRQSDARLNDRPVTSPRDAIDQGVFLVPSDRKTQGLVPMLPIRSNLTLAILGRLSRWGLLDGAQEKRQVAEKISQLSIRPADPDKPVLQLSGGNQQKVVIGKALATEPRVLLLDEPTRGVDVGARNELYDVIEALAGEGLGLLVSSSDTEELSALCDRVLVFRKGRVVKELRAPFSSQEVVQHVTGAN